MISDKYRDKFPNTHKELTISLIINLVEHFMVPPDSSVTKSHFYFIVNSSTDVTTS